MKKASALPMLAGILISALTPNQLSAQTAAALNDNIPAAQSAASTVALAVSNSDNAWILVCSALVLMMTAPGLILFYGGLVRSKNVLATMMHSMILMGVVSMLWMIFGYSMSFGEGNAFFGSFTQYFMLRDVGSAPNADYAGTIPHQSFMLFQMMFAIITPALISGAIAERIKFSSFLVFTILWMTVVYFPICHMVWGKGGLMNWALGGKIPVLDFAGGTVVHISSGISALVCALMLGKRMGYPREPMPPHNVVYSLIGTGLLWVGWFGFNAGSALSAGTLATSTFAATHFSAVGAALSWTLIEWQSKGKPSVLGTASGMVAGLATITPASGFVNVPTAFCIGMAGGVICYLAVTKVKSRFAYDDSLDVFGVHCVGSIVGMVLLGVTASITVNPAIASTFMIDGKAVSLAGSSFQLFAQLKGILITLVWSAVASVGILKLVQATMGLRVEDEHESMGLDLSQHGESAYND